MHNVKDEEDFKEQVKNAGDKLVVAVFTATWCGPCSNLNVHLKALSLQYEDQVLILKIDVDEVSDLATFEFNVSTMPTLVFFKNGKTVDRFVGANAAQLKEVIKKYTE